MKSLFLPFTLTVATLLAGTVEAAQCGSKECSTHLKTSTTVRQYSAIGVKNTKRDVFNKPTRGWFTTEWKKTMGKVVTDANTCAFEKHYPALVAKFRWSEAYVNDQIKPTRSQARDPNWSNYIWNQKEPSSGYVIDGISDALESDLINNGSGIAKLSVSIGLSATSDNLLPPGWMRKDKALTWVEGRNNNGKNNNWHVRFDNPVAVDHAEDFLAAFLAKYGNNKGLHSINIGEYYFGQKQYIPSGLDRTKYSLGVKNLWEQMVAAAPRDENGQRINIVQTNPMFASGLTVEDMEALEIGISTSDTNISFPVSSNSVSDAMRKLYDGKKTHVMIAGDARYACQGRRQQWSGTANPFGHRKGYSGVATPQEILWYHGEAGPVPTHSIFMTIATWCDGPQTTQNFIDAIRKFGRCGTEAHEWGAAPAIFSTSSSNSSNIAVTTSKPKPPIVLVH